MKTNYFKTSHNVFLTGQAGTGKTYTINEYIKWAKEEGINVVLAASTGIAAVNINGVTIHSFLGSKICNSINEYKNHKVSKTHWRDIVDLMEYMDVLVVDEVSMLSASFIDMMDYIMKKALNSEEPFGGKKVIFTGDFLQLPPVIKKNNIKERTFAFQSEAWKKAEFKILNLSKIYRQTDKLFMEMLSKVRMGDNSSEVVDYFEQMNLNEFPDDDSVKLFSRNINVDAYNKKELDKIEGKSFEYEASMRGISTEKEKLRKRVLADDILTLKEGARVISLKNALDLSYVNGSTGTVLELLDNSVIVEFDNGLIETITYGSWENSDPEGNVLAMFEQIPLKLAYGITIHKSQGMTIDKLTVECSNIFEEGQLYVALSRAVSSESLNLVGFKKEQINTNKTATNFYKAFKFE